MPVVLVCGASGSGKSTLAKILAERVPHAIIIPQDGFFRGPKNWNYADEGLTDAHEAPSAVDFSRLRAAVCKASSAYVSALIILEGHVLLSDPATVALATAVVVLDGNADICRERRVQRKHRSEEEKQSIRRYFDTIVWPAYMRHTAPLVTGLRGTPPSLVLPADLDVHAKVDKVQQWLATWCCNDAGDASPLVVSSHSCPACGKFFPKRMGLKQHIRNKHQEVDLGEGVSVAEAECSRLDKTGAGSGRSRAAMRRHRAQLASNACSTDASGEVNDANKVVDYETLPEMIDPRDSKTVWLEKSSKAAAALSQFLDEPPLLVPSPVDRWRQRCRFAVDQWGAKDGEFKLVRRLLSYATLIPCRNERGPFFG